MNLLKPLLWRYLSIGFTAAVCWAIYSILPEPVPDVRGADEVYPDKVTSGQQGARTDWQNYDFGRVHVHTGQHCVPPAGEPPCDLTGR